MSPRTLSLLIGFGGVAVVMAGLYVAVSLWERADRRKRERQERERPADVAP